MGIAAIPFGAMWFTDRPSLWDGGCTHNSPTVETMGNRNPKMSPEPLLSAQTANR
jgi:hypothetical protein